jgi:hypothetical protein
MRADPYDRMIWNCACAHGFFGDPASGFHKLAGGIQEVGTVNRKNESDADRYIFDLYQEIYRNPSKAVAKATAKMHFTTSNQRFPYFGFPAIYLAGAFLHG